MEKGIRGRKGKKIWREACAGGLRLAGFCKISASFARFCKKWLLEKKNRRKKKENAAKNFAQKMREESEIMENLDFMNAETLFELARNRADGVYEKFLRTGKCARRTFCPQDLFAKIEWREIEKTVREQVGKKFKRWVLANGQKIRICADPTTGKPIKTDDDARLQYYFNRDISI